MGAKIDREDGAAFDAAQYSFFGDLVASDSLDGALGGGLEEEDGLLGGALEVRAASAGLPICAIFVILIGGICRL
jgi:hypothetical protein